MKRIRFGKIRIASASDSLIIRSVDACLSLPSLTRNTVSNATGISPPSAGKILHAMHDCRFLKRSPAVNADHSDLYTISPELCALVLDLSSACFEAYITDCVGSILFSMEYLCSSEITKHENLLLFFSRVGTKIAQSELSPSSLCVIYGESGTGKRSPLFRDLLPSADDTELLYAHCAKFFSLHPLACLTSAEAVGYGLRYLCSDAPKDTVYVRYGRYPYAAFISSEGMTRACKLNSLLCKNGMTLEEAYDSLIHPPSASSLLGRLIEATDCAFSPDKYVLEYDSRKFDGEMLAVFKRHFALCGETLPNLTVTGKHNSYAVHGAARLVTSRFICAHLGVSSKNNS